MACKLDRKTARNGDSENTMPILLNDFKAQWQDIASRALKAVDRVGKSGWLILGTEVQSFENDLADHWGLPFAMGCASGLDALEIGLRVIGLNPGDKVLTTPLSAFATTLAIIRAGGVPVFVDVDDSGLIDLALAEAALKADRSIKFMVPVHLYGHALDLAELARLKNSYGLKVVEDCAQAIGARSDGRPVGSVGEIAATSFYPTKNLGALGDGGALLTASPEIDRACRVLRDYGQSAKYVHTELGLNSRLDELHAAILKDALLPTLKSHTEKRRAIAQQYGNLIRNPKLEAPPRPNGSDSVWHLYPLIVDGNRAGFQNHLKINGVGSAVHYPRLISEQQALTKILPQGAPVFGPLTKAAIFANQEVSIPIHPYLMDDEVSRVIQACNSWKG